MTLDKQAFLTAGFARLGELYGRIDPQGSHEVAARQQAICDACLDALGTASCDDEAAFERAFALLGVLDHAF
jgi:hypothetical protein